MPVRKIRRGAVEPVVGGPGWNTLRVDATTDTLRIGTGVSGTTEKQIVDTTSTQTLTNKTIAAPTAFVDGASGTAIQNAADATKQVKFDISTLTAGQTTTLQFPDTNGTQLVLTQTATQTGITNKTFTSPTIAAITGACSVGGSVTSNDATTPSFILPTGKTNTGTVVVNGKTSGSLTVTTADATAQAVTVSAAAQTAGASTLTIPDQAGTARNFVFDTLIQTLTNKTLTAPLSTLPAFGVATGGVGSETIGTFFKTGLTDAAATQIAVVTIPNAVHGGIVEIEALGVLGDGDSCSVAKYQAAFSRITGANALKVLSAAVTEAHTTGATANATTTITLGTVTGAVGASNTFAINITVTRSAGASTNHVGVVSCKLLNAFASGLSIAQG